MGYAVGGSLLGVVVLVVIVVVAVLVYFRWRAYSYRVQPRFQGTASNLKESQYVSSVVFTTISRSRKMMAIAWVAVVFGINSTSNAEVIVRGEAECNLLHYKCY